MAAKVEVKTVSSTYILGERDVERGSMPEASGGDRRRETRGWGSPVRRGIMNLIETGGFGKPVGFSFQQLYVLET